jgi:hypothetical protein
MSWEDCGFKPAPHEPKYCRQCSDCDGEHHFYVTCADGCDDDDDPLEVPEGIDRDMHFVCKHCGLRVNAIDEDESEADSVWQEGGQG